MPEEMKIKQKNTGSTSGKRKKITKKQSNEKLSTTNKKISADTKQNDQSPELKSQEKKSPENKKTINTSESKNSKKSKVLRIVIAIGGLIIIAIACGFLIPFLVDRLNISSDKILERFAEKHSYVVDIENYTTETDPNGIMGNENAYISKSSWGDNRLESIPEGVAGTMEVFRNTKDAEIREWKLNYTKENCRNYITPEKYGEELSDYVCNGLSYGTIYRNSVVVIRLTRALSDEQVEEYKHGFDDLISGFIINESNTPTDEKVEELKKDIEKDTAASFEGQVKSFEDDLNNLADDFEKQIKAATESLSDDDYAELKDSLNYVKTIPFFSDKLDKWTTSVKNVKNKITEKKNAVIANINNRLSAIASSLSESELSKVKEDIKNITDPYYDSYKEKWESKISSIETSIERKKLAAKNRTFSAGKYTVGSDIESGTYDIIAVRGSGNLFIYNSSQRLDVNEVMDVYGRYGFSTKYNNEYLGYGYTIEIRSDLVLKFEAKK